MIKVYATVGNQNNLITTIPFKGVKVRVEFSGGNSMKNIPAKLFTRDPFVIKALDSSDQLGRLYSVHKIIEEEGDKQKTSAAEPKPQAAQMAEPTNLDESTQEYEPKKPAQPVLEGEGDGEGAGEKMEFDNLAEAVTYIATTWGEQVENESQARKFIEEKTGIKPIIHKG